MKSKSYLLLVFLVACVVKARLATFEENIEENTDYENQFMQESLVHHEDYTTSQEISTLKFDYDDSGTLKKEDDTMHDPPGITNDLNRSTELNELDAASTKAKSHMRRHVDSISSSKQKRQQQKSANNNNFNMPTPPSQFFYNPNNPAASPQYAAPGQPPPYVIINAGNQPQLVGSEKTMEQFLDRLLHESIYDRRIRPFYTDSKNSLPVEVLMNMHINTISAINEVYMDYTVDCFFRQEWFDPRLKYSNSSWKHVDEITLHYDLVNKVWTPDAFFRNAKEGKSHLITVPNRLIRIFPEGRVLFSQRLTLKLECPMKLQKFPLDNQTCTINIGSFGYTTKDVKFLWKTAGGPRSAVTINSKLEMPDFLLKMYNASVCLRKTATGEYACLEVHFFFERAFGYYLVQVYIPSVLTCLIAFVSFWIDHKAVPARISVGLLTVLTITTQSSGIRSQLPKVSYIKAIDVWMSACLVFVFAALLEYAVVNVIARKQELKKLIRMHEKHRHESRRQHTMQKLANSANNNEKVMAIGNRLANLNTYKAKSDHIDNLNNSQEALETLLQPNMGYTNSIRKTPHSNNSLHVDSAVSISGISQQSTPPIAPSPPIITNPLSNNHIVSLGSTGNHISSTSANQITGTGSSNGGNGGNGGNSHSHHHHSTGSALAPIATAIAAVGKEAPKDDAQMVDFVSSFLFPISFIVFNIIYWMVYLNMQVESNN